MNGVLSPSHALRVAGAVAEDQIKLGEIEVLNGEGVEHEVLPESAAPSPAGVACRRADAAPRNSFGKRCGKATVV